MQNKMAIKLWQINELCNEFLTKNHWMDNKPIVRKNLIERQLRPPPVRKLC